MIFIEKYKDHRLTIV